MTSPATDVFVSYKAEDRSRLVPLVDALEDEGFSVWWDAHIGGGTNWQEDIERHLESAKCVIVAWSKRSIGPDGHFVRDEARRAQRRGAYIPVCLDGVEPPLGFGEIQSLPLKGWKGDRSDPRFQAIARAVRSQVSGEDGARERVRSRQPRVSRRAVMAGGAGVVAVTAAGGWFLLKPAPVNAKRIAVMPFANLSGAADQAYFAEGIAEELRAALSRIGLQVIGRSSSDAVKDLDTKAAASKLGVANILTGSVRRSPRMVRISAQLVGGSDGVERWSQSYDRALADEIGIQTDIATNVAQALSIALGQAGKAALTHGGTADAAAQDLLMRASRIRDTGSSAESLREVISLADAAIARDPNYADAYRLKAVTLEVLGAGFPEGPDDMAAKLAQAEAAARRAIALAPRLGSAYLALARVQTARFEFGSALRNMRRGLALSPEVPGVVSPAVNFALTFGDAGKALELVDRAIMLDPLQAAAHGQRSHVLFYLRRYPQAIDAARKADALDSQPTAGSTLIGRCLILMNRPVEARAEYQKVSYDDPFRLIDEAILAARLGDIKGAERLTARIRDMVGEAASYQYAEIQAQAGNVDAAFAELDNAVRVKDTGLLSLKLDPFLDPIRDDPRYAALLKRLNFPTWT